MHIFQEEHSNIAALNTVRERSVFKANNIRGAKLEFHALCKFKLHIVLSNYIH